MRKLALLIIMIVPFISKAQSGIHFEHGLTWDQIQIKAKAEHKDIFVDCYATWCGPCKEMDKDVYPLKIVGDTYNKQFINVRIQMDKTSKDGAEIKKDYELAQFLASIYRVNEYPTFLFFDSDGQPMHKAIGAITAKDFTRLAVDALDPAKQYYQVVKNFKPGNVDTAELKSLAYLFIDVDKGLAGKMAADYLNRIPEAQVGSKSNLALMVRFQDNPQVLDKALTYLSKQDKQELMEPFNTSFMLQMNEQKKIKEIVVNYINSLRREEFMEHPTIRFIAQWREEPKIREIAGNYINHLAETELYAPENINYLAIFTKTTTDRGFELFYHHADQIDAVMKDKGFAWSIAENVIRDEELTAMLDAAKEKMEKPDFDSISATITKKYSQYFAKRIVINGQASWYAFLVNKKLDQYWPDLLNRRIEQGEMFRYDTLKLSSRLMLNNMAYSDFFKHCDSPEQLNIVAGWVKNMLTQNPEDKDVLDTYASILYKAGRLNEAIESETKALEIAKERKDNRNSEFYAKTIDKMKKGEKIWLEKY